MTVVCCIPEDSKPYFVSNYVGICPDCITIVLDSVPGIVEAGSELAFVLGVDSHSLQPSFFFLFKEETAVSPSIPLVF